MMRYRDFGRMGYKVSALGFGAMRLPEDGGGRVDVDAAVALVRAAVDAGVNYVDTAPFYSHDQSEETVGRALRDGYRERVWLSTKYFHAAEDGADDYRRKLEASLAKLGTDYLDVYHFWGVSWEAFDAALRPRGLVAAARRCREEGLFRHLFFSFHAPPEDLTRLIDTGEFDGCTVQYNLIDRRYEQGLAHAAARGLGVVVMGPVGGGRLAGPSSVIAGLPIRSASTPELALRFVLANRNVNCALSGMGDRRMLAENLATAARAEPLAPAELAAVEAGFDEFQKLAELYCTGCNYCAPCPAKVPIARILSLYNLARVYGLEEAAVALYDDIGKRGFFASAADATACNSCGECSEKCPQKLDIPAELAAAHDDLNHGR